MKQDQSFIDHEFLLELINHIPDAIVVLDKKMHVKFSNQLFNNLFQEQTETNFNKILGHTLGCRVSHGNLTPGEVKINCANCKLKNSVLEAFTTKKTQNPDTVVLQVISKAVEPLKLIQYQAAYISVRGKAFVLLKLIDLTELGLKTVGMISND